MNWGDQIGSAAEGIGMGAAGYELAKNAPKETLAVVKSTQTMGFIIFIVFLIFIAIGCVVFMTMNNNHKNDSN
jgi:hypothetical protein